MRTQILPALWPGVTTTKGPRARTQDQATTITLTDAEVWELTQPGAWMTVADVIAMTGASRSTLDEWRAAGHPYGARMPQPRRAHNGRVTWSRREIAQWWVSLPLAAA